MELTLLEFRLLAAFEQAIAEGRPDIADIVLAALEAMDARDSPSAALEAAYLMIGQGIVPPTGGRH